MNGGVRHISARVRGTDAAEAVLALLDDATGAVSAYQAADGWRLDAYAQGLLRTPDLSARMALAAAAAGGELLEIDEQTLIDRDWLTENQLAFPPLRIGRGM